MKVKSLISILKKMPQDANVKHLWDGEARTSIEHVWLSVGGDIITADHEMICYDSKTRPINVLNSEEKPYWKSPSK